MINRSTRVVFIKTKNRLIYIWHRCHKKESYGRKRSFKHLIGYNNNDFIRPLCTKIPQMIRYVKHFDSNKTMCFKVNDNRLLNKYVKIWETLISYIELNIELDRKPVYGDMEIKWIQNFRGKNYQKKMHHLSACD